MTATLIRLPVPKPASKPNPPGHSRGAKRLELLARGLIAEVTTRSQQAAARAIDAPITTYWRYRRLFQDGGLTALEGKPMGRPPKRKPKKPARKEAVYKVQLRRVS